MIKSRMLGEFLVKNGVVTADQMLVALDDQRMRAHKFSVIAELEKMLPPEDVERLMMHQLENDCTIEESILSLKLLSKKELEELVVQVSRTHRVPVGQILINMGFVGEAKLQEWIDRFKHQDFQDATVVKEFLKGIPLFSGLNKKKINQVYSLLTYKQFNAGEIIYREGFDSLNLFIVDSGLVRLTIHSGENEIELGSLKAGDYFGLNSVLTGEPYMERASSVMNSSVWRLDRNDLIAMIRENADMALVAANILSSQVQSLMGTIREKKTKLKFSNILMAMIHESIEDAVSIARALADGLCREADDAVLLVHSMEISGWPSTDECSIRKILRRKPKTIIAKRILAIHAPDIEYTDDIEVVAQWLQHDSLKYAAVVFIVRPGSPVFRLFSLENSWRSVVFLKEQVPDYLAYLRPGRDRVYLVEAGSLEKSIGAYRKLLDLLPDKQAVIAPHLIKKSRYTDIGEQLARWFTGKSVGIAFGGGGARGLSQIGIYSVLERAGFKIDAVAGCSFGAFTAGCISLGMTAEDFISVITKEVIDPGKNPFNDFTLFPFLIGALAKGKKAARLLRKVFHDRHCLETVIPYFPMATVMDNGTEISIRDSSMVKAALGSGAAPGFLPLVEYRGLHLGDGGMVNNVPASPLKDYGCDFVISINISIDPALSGFNPRSVTSNMFRGIDILMYQSLKKYINYTDFELKPDVGRYSVVDFKKGKEIIQIGRDTMNERLDELKRMAGKRGIKPEGTHEPGNENQGTAGTGKNER